MIVVAVAVIAVGGVAALMFGSGGGKGLTTSGQTSSTPPTSSTAQPVGNVTQAFLAHLNTIQTRQVDKILLAYQPNALVVWTGTTAGLGGTYSGSGNIKLLYSGALGTASSIQITYSNLKTYTTGSTVSANATLKINGTSGVLGPYNGTITAKVTFTSTPGGLMISYEHWNYDAFLVTNSGGATTFPEWQRVGEPITTHRSPDWLHNFAWDYGGPAFAIFVWVLVVFVMLVAVGKAASRHKPLQS
jgi:hypothetical protein